MNDVTDLTDLLDGFAADAAADDAADLARAEAGLAAAEAAAAAVEDAIEAAPAAPAVPPQPSEPPTIPAAAEPGIVHTQKRALPEGRVSGGDRLPRAGQVADLSAPAEPAVPPKPATPPTAPAPELIAEDDQDDQDGQDGQDGEPEKSAVGRWWTTVKAAKVAAPAAEADTADAGQQDAPVPPKPQRPPTAGTPAKATKPAKPGDDKAGKGWKPKDPRMRFVLFNGAAAAIGYGVGASGLFDGFMPAADQSITGTVGLALNLAGWYGAWRFLGHPAVDQVLPGPPYVARIVCTLSVGELCRRLAPQGVAWLDQHGTSWGLGPGAASLLITAAIVNGGLYWFIDRKVRHRPALVRFILRIPLATAAVTTLMYAPGPII